VFDWSVIIPQYEALWSEQDARRRAYTPVAESRSNPFRPDPYALFASYPTRWLGHDDQVALVPGMNVLRAHERLSAPLAAYSDFNRISEVEVEAIVTRLAGAPSVTVQDLLEPFPRQRRNFVERGLLWLARHDIVAILPRP
jgi:hypothetical protein